MSHPHTIPPAERACSDDAVKFGRLTPSRRKGYASGEAKQNKILCRFLQPQLSFPCSNPLRIELAYLHSGSPVMDGNNMLPKTFFGICQATCPSLLYFFKIEMRTKGKHMAMDLPQVHFAFALKSGSISESFYKHKMVGFASWFAIVTYISSSGVG